jgi:TolA-binding protein
LKASFNTLDQVEDKISELEYKVDELEHLESNNKKRKRK